MNVMGTKQLYAGTVDAHGAEDVGAHCSNPAKTTFSCVAVKLPVSVASGVAVPNG